VEKNKPDTSTEIPGFQLHFLHLASPNYDRVPANALFKSSSALAASATAAGKD
jgi:hypothetical protein